MAKPRIFLSSTFYDLKQVRADIDMFIESLGYEPVRNEEGDIPYGKDDALEEYCYKEIKTIDILISIIGGRFGSESRRNSASVSQIELKTALKEGKQIYIFIDKNVLAEYETYLLNKENETKFRYVDDSRVYKFIEEIKGLNANNNIKGFETANDITKYLREQFAGLFQRFLEEQTRIKEISIISNLEKTAQTLNKLVNYLSDENKDQAEEINRILTINHTLVEKLRTLLNIPYNFYIEGYNDLNALLGARGVKLVEPNPYSDEEDGYYQWIKDAKGKTINLKISKSLFDEEGRLKFIKKSDWNDEYVIYYEKDKPEDDGLPF
jgi:fructose-specific phosphotransferase system component IIB